MPGPGYPFSAPNQNGIAQMLPMFLCPSDIAEQVKPPLAPTNYVMCAGSGAGGGTPFNTDGVFYANSATTYADITDGSSQDHCRLRESIGYRHRARQYGRIYRGDPATHLQIRFELLGHTRLNGRAM